MAGEHVFVAEESSFIQEVCRAVLEEHGYRVTCASNGLAAVNCPGAEEVDLFVFDGSMPGWDGAVTTKTVRQTTAVATKPVLMLINDSEVDGSESVSLHGADAYLLKPFTPAQLVRKIGDLLEECAIRQESERRLAEVASETITGLAEQTIEEVVEQKTQLIVERMIQQVIEVIDDKARREIDRKVTALGAEKEQELIRATVTEVSRSMIDKQAEQRVGEAIESELEERLEKAVRRAAEAIVPTIARERIKDSLQSILQREVQVRVAQAAESLVPDVSHKLVATVDGLSQKIIPKVARDIVPEIAERQIRTLSEKAIPQQIDSQVRTQVFHQMRDQIQPELTGATKKLWIRVLAMNGLLFASIAVFMLWWFAGSGIPLPWQDGEVQVTLTADDE